jgi:phosphoglycolate phosphatase-like HAD superfamily hydrolase
MSLKVLILDFDGVILESNHIKDDAFKHTFSNHPTHLDAIMAYHHSTHGIIRFKKFKYIVETILGGVYTPQMEAQLASRFSSFVLNAVTTCSFVEGAQEFLKFFYGKVPMYLVSVNPPQDLEYTLGIRGLKHYFKKVYATDQKTEAVADILTNEKLDSTEAVFIGDALADFKAASANNVPFIGRDSGAFQTTQEFPVLNNLKEIQEYLCPHVKLSR